MYFLKVDTFLVPRYSDEKTKKNKH